MSFEDNLKDNKKISLVDGKLFYLDFFDNFSIHVEFYFPERVIC